MHYYLVIPLRITHSTTAELTYESSDELPIGCLVTIPLGSRSAPGIVIRATAQPKFATKSITSRLEDQPIPARLLALAQWLSTYYASHPVTVWQTLLPSGLTKQRRPSNKELTHPLRDRTHIVLNHDQQAAYDAIVARPAGTSLVHGVTGSGKTQLYIELARTCIASGRSAIILVPEIALTSQIIAEFKPHFPDLVVTHSTMTESERHTVWRTLLGATSPHVIIGPRSALFAPVRDLGLIVIDECHEPSFKQEQSPRYSALRAAAVLARHAQAHLVLGSATPSISDYYLALQTQTPILRLTKPARHGTVEPTVEVVDMTKRHHFGRHRFLSSTLIDGLSTTLAAGHQALLFHNRRGTAPITLCEQCGWSASCERCFVPLTLHNDTYELRCHICNYRDRVPTACSSCGNASIIHKGIGTKLLASELAKLFPDARIARFDGDTDTAATLEKQYQALYDGDIDIIIGTQVVAKGLDLPKLRFVGVVQADSGLSLPDYQASERVFQLISQVCGRVGRNEHASQVVVQSYQPTHPAVAYGIARDYAGFYGTAIAERKRANFPPFCFLLKIVCTYKTEAAAIRASQALARSLRATCPADCEILGPTPAFYERVRDTYRWQIIVKSPRRAELAALIDLIPPTKWQYELDPASLL